MTLYDQSPFVSASVYAVAIRTIPLTLVVASGRVALIVISVAVSVIVIAVPPTKLLRATVVCNPTGLAIHMPPPKLTTSTRPIFVPYISD